MLDTSGRDDQTGMWDTFWFVKASSIFQIPVVVVPSLEYVTEQTISQFADHFQKFSCESPRWDKQTNTPSLLQSM